MELLQPTINHRITQGFRDNPSNGFYGFFGHTGIDFGAVVAGKEGDKLYACADATVKKVAFDDNGYGNYIELDLGWGYTALYAHCKSIVVSAGMKVYMGQVIAFMGTTGHSTAPHLHFEIKQFVVKKNPLDYLIITHEQLMQFEDRIRIMEEQIRSLIEADIALAAKINLHVSDLEVKDIAKKQVKKGVLAFVKRAARRNKKLKE